MNATHNINVGIAKDGTVYLYSKRDNNRIVVDLKGIQNAITIIKDYSPLAAECLRLKSQGVEKDID